MQEIKPIVVTKCDFCANGNNVWEKCKGCSKDVCYECQKIKGIKFSYEIHFSGTHDGFYCSECLANPRVLSSDTYKAYKTIRDLRVEHDAWWKDFDIRGNKANENLKRLLGE